MTEEIIDAPVYEEGRLPREAKPSEVLVGTAEVTLASVQDVSLNKSEGKHNMPTIIHSKYIN